FTVIRDSTPAAEIPKGTVVAMGNFDGVHLGHRAVIAAALKMGKANGRPALAVTFEPHPRRFFSPPTPQFRLSDETANLRLLAAEGPRLGIEVDVQPHVDIDERPVSSSAIRSALAEGQIEDATAMLGGPWFVTGEVIHGEKRGRELGYPTANIRLDHNCGLKHGIYAVRLGR